MNEWCEINLDELGQGAVDEVLEGTGVRHEQGAELPPKVNIQLIS